MNFLNNNINIKDYRAQIYDNSSNISGRLNEMQDIIINYSSSAICIPHAVHSSGCGWEVFRIPLNTRQLYQYYLLSYQINIIYLANLNIEYINI